MKHSLQATEGITIDSIVYTMGMHGYIFYWTKYNIISQPQWQTSLQLAIETLVTPPPMYSIRNNLLFISNQSVIQIIQTLELYEIPMKLNGFCLIVDQSEETHVLNLI